MELPRLGLTPLSPIHLRPLDVSMKAPGLCAKSNGRSAQQSTPEVRRHEGLTRSQEQKDREGGLLTTMRELMEDWLAWRIRNGKGDLKKTHGPS